MHKNDQPCDCFFIGSIPFNKNISGAAYSEAGKQVQLEIIESLERKIPGGVKTISLDPIQVFPKGNLFSKYKIQNSTIFLPYINLPIVKHLLFSIGLFIYLMLKRPKKIFVYNSYFFNNLALIAYKKFSNKSKVVIFIQDVLSVGRGLQAVQKYLDRKSLNLLNSFDLVVPISNHIINDFKINIPSYLVQGGLTREIISHFQDDNETTKEPIYRAVYAGALEPYNGIELLINEWKNQKIKVELHIFGKGALAEFAAEAARLNDNIFFHGFTPHSVVQEFISDSKIIFILRFDLGIESKYFFPSKFWEALFSNSNIACNSFSGIPEDLKDFCFILNDDLSNLRDMDSALERLNDQISIRRKYVLENHTWQKHIDKIVQFL